LVDAPSATWLTSPVGAVSSTNPGVKLLRFGDTAQPANAVVPASLLNEIGEVSTLLEEGDGAARVVWIAGARGLLRCVLTDLPRETRPNSPMLRRVSPARPGASEEVRFEYSSPWFKSGEPMMYQTRLDGLTDAWSEFSAEPHTVFHRPPAGHFTFRVRARNADGLVGPESTHTFMIPKPWWLTPWMFGLYAIAAAGAVTTGVRWRLRTVQRRNAELEQIVTQRTAELRDAKGAAESANHAKSAFLANMSHELRTPLNAILGYAQILRKETGLSDKGRHQLGIVGRNGEHLLQMINEVLDLAKIEAGKMTLHAADFPLARVVKTAADLLEQRAAEKRLAFRLEFGAGLPRTVSTDEQKLRQVLLNLLGNAVKFTVYGEVVLSVARHDAHVRFEVRDTGPGIAPDQIEAIFQP
ncbi:MAG TPA: histidine kinase dimerization/phospho-acceptor domain-containing protein, partial [Opitutus sp.]|nr:histidine kinase dimerization/phospho-acceptor domain-containing protein [Opitutus sp.]